MNPKIPTGWRKLRVGCKVRVGDRWWDENGWMTVRSNFDATEEVRSDEIVIREKGKRAE